MKKIISLTIVFLVLALSHEVKAQEYKKMMSDPNANFYDIQREFNEYWQAKDKDVRKEEEEGDDDGEYVQFKRWESFMEPRVYPSGKMINVAAKIFQAWQIENAQRDNSGNSLLSTNGNWTTAGPTNCVLGGGTHKKGLGRVNCIAFDPNNPDPNNPNIIYCGTPDGGLWKSDNGGIGWVPLTDGIPLIGVSGIAINPNNSNQIYILTGDDVWNGQASIGVLKSDNGGTTWVTTGLTFGTNDNVRGYKLMIDPVNSNILFAITDNGIYKTLDGGANWPLVLPGNFYDCEFKPGDHNIIYASTGSQFWRSYNNGDPTSWQQIISAFLTAPCPNPPNSNYASPNCRIAVSSLNSNYVYILFDCQTGTPNNNTIVCCLSTNSGISFGPNITQSIAGTGLGGQSANLPNDLTFGVDPTHLNYLYAGGLDIYKSMDGGAHWSQKTDGNGTSLTWLHHDQRALEFSGSTIFPGCDGGIFKSTNGANNFTDLSDGLAITQIGGIGGTPQNSNLYFFGAQDNGVSKLDIAANVNTHIVDGDGGKCIIDFTNSSTAYMQQGAKIWKTNDGGSSKSEIQPSAVGGFTGGPLIMSPISSSTLYAGWASYPGNIGSIWINTNGGSSGWTNLLDNLGPQVAMGIGTNDPNSVYSAEATVFRRSFDGGSSWFDLSGTLPVANASISCMAVSTIDANNVWVGFSGYNTGGFRVYKTTGGGPFWTNISGTLPDVPVNCISVVPGSPINALYIGTDIGVYYTDDNLGYWIPFRNGLPNVRVTDLYINVNANKIAAATFGRGVWTSDLYNTCISNFQLIPNNPEPGGFQRFNCSNSIDSYRQYVGGIGTDIKYNAGGLIDLYPNFRFDGTGGAIFTASIGGCPPPPAGPVKPLSGTWGGVMVPSADNATMPVASSTARLNDNEVNIQPNPFNSTFELTVNLKENKKVSVVIYDILGIKVKEITERSLSKGFNKLSFDCDNLAQGVYMIEINMGDTKTVKRIVKS